MHFNIIALNVFAAITTAYVLPDTASSGAKLSARQVASAADIILQIAPSSKSCAGAEFADECATNVQAAPHLINAMAQHKVYNPHEISAVLALVAFESGEFKYNKNHFPGRPGQGTRNMQMPNYNLMYAKSIPALSSKLSAITTSDSVNGLSDDKLNALSALVMTDEYTYGSAPWFLATQCASARKAIQAGGDSGLQAYAKCVGVEVTSERKQYYDRAIKAFGL